MALDQVDHLEEEDLLDHLAPLDLVSVCQVPLDQVDCQEDLDLWDLLDCLASQEDLDLLDHQDLKVRREIGDYLVDLEDLDFKDGQV